MCRVSVGFKLVSKWMLKNYSEYIDLYLSEKKNKINPYPGEHHFVSSYLVPRLFSINQRVPDYINPDGTKNIIGDVVYYQDNEHQLGIEVKLETIRLTKNEFNKWIVSTDESHWPHTFIAIGENGLALCSWTKFRDTYISSVREQKKNPQWEPLKVTDGYGPQKSVNTFLTFLPKENCYLKAKDKDEAIKREKQFMLALASEIDC